MQEAGFVNFFRTILIILLVIYGLRFLARFVLPLLLKRAVNKAQERAQNRYDNSSYEKQPNVGETIIDKKPKTTNQSQANDIGEYVDYEEVD